MFDEICYNSNYLKNVIVRLDFSNEIGELSELPKTVQNLALKSFPIPEPRKTSTTEWQLSPDKVKQKQTEFMEWKFFSRDRKRVLTIYPAAIFIEFSSYKNFENFRNEFLCIVEGLFDIYKDTLCRRLGLRYINEIAMEGNNPFDWDDYLHPKLLAALHFIENSQFIARSFHLLELNYGDINLRYQFGMHNPDFPAPIKKKIFIMDFDAYNEGLQEFKDISENLDSYHQKIQELFEQSITDRLREAMNA